MQWQIAKEEPAMTIRINVIDPDVRRRARISHALHARDAHVEIYENAEELTAGGKASGLVFAFDAPEAELAGTIHAIRGATETILPVVGYAEQPEPEHVVAAMRAGAIDYLRWPFAKRLLDGVFHRLVNGDDRFLHEQLLRSRARVRINALSGRETDVLTQLVRGLSNKEIGRVLAISPRTVEVHRANMMSKIGAHSSPEAVRIGIYGGLGETEDEPDELLAVA
jgi:FixJ family two-component response regulator